MAKVPRSQEVIRAIQSLVRQIKLATKEANQLAAKRLTRGDYVKAQTLIDTAKSVSAFGNEVAGLLGRWKEVRLTNKDSKKGKDNQTPLWEFYRPILQALVSIDGEGTRQELEKKFEETMINNLKEGDFVKNTHGMPRWKVMIRKARKHMITEGFISGEKPHIWMITSKGEQAAKSGVKSK
jgi:hypothetical protein